MKLLQSRILSCSNGKQQQELSKQRKEQVGTGERAEKFAPTIIHKIVLPITKLMLRLKNLIW